MNPNIQIRWLIRRDMPEVLDIERASFATAWTDDDFLVCLRQRNCTGHVAEIGGKIVGFMVYELFPTKLGVLNFAVHPEFRRQGVGHAMIERLIDKLSQQRRNELRVEVRESNFDAQVFFRAMRFLAVDVIRGLYEDSGEDCYVMQFHLDAQPQRKDKMCQEGRGK